MSEENDSGESLQQTLVEPKETFRSQMLADHGKPQETTGTTREHKRPLEPSLPIWVHGKIFQTCHTGIRLGLGNTIQGDHCIPIP